MRNEDNTDHSASEQDVMEIEEEPNRSGKKPNWEPHGKKVMVKATRTKESKYHTFSATIAQRSLSLDLHHRRSLGIFVKDIRNLVQTWLVQPKRGKRKNL